MSLSLSHLPLTYILIDVIRVTVLGSMSTRVIVPASDSALASGVSTTLHQRAPAPRKGSSCVARRQARQGNDPRSLQGIFKGQFEDSPLNVPQRTPRIPYLHFDFCMCSIVHVPPGAPPFWGLPSAAPLRLLPLYMRDVALHRA